MLLHPDIDIRPVSANEPSHSVDRAAQSGFCSRLGKPPPMSGRAQSLEMFGARQQGSRACGPQGEVVVAPGQVVADIPMEPEVLEPPPEATPCCALCPIEPHATQWGMIARGLCFLTLAGFAIAALVIALEGGATDSGSGESGSGIASGVN